MEISELLEKRNQLQHDLEGTIGPLIVRFRTETGFPIKSIDVPMLDIRRCGLPIQSEPGDTVLGPISVRLDL
jgi:hypothetical protein